MGNISRISSHDKRVHAPGMHSSSSFKEVRKELVLMTDSEMLRTMQVTELKPEWLVEIAPHYYQLKDVDDGKCGT
jgi:pre-mRNA-splicing factor ATP-dependent RNA helicase DHX16